MILSILKKLTSLLLSSIIILSLTCISVSASVSEENEIKQSIVVEKTVAELQDGIEIQFYIDGMGTIHTMNENTIAPYDSMIGVGTFSVKLKRYASSKGYLGWTLTTGPGLTGIKGVSGTMYCKDPSILFPKVYHEKPFASGTLTGTSNIATGSSNFFALPSAGTKVRVGWSNVIFRTITDSYSTSNASSIVIV